MALTHALTHQPIVWRKIDKKLIKKTIELKGYNLDLD